MKHLFGLACAFLLSSTVAAHAQSTQPSGYGPPIALDDALTIVQRGRELATRCGLTMALAVVEPSGELVAFVRMEGTPYASSALAQQKARASARFRMSTAQFEERVQGGRAVLMSSDEVIAIGGGVPIIEGGRVIGALGVSGGSAAQDAAIANLALELFGAESNPSATDDREPCRITP